ncbi:lytic transglycosylase domain-containing protein [Solibacillus sp. R5-41]|uniref:lytic transglycosylase domain-containing protein n=1 Tax=Solibacillus sp. R5-41 TaxID=2048654 RepID=UPI0020A2E30D|nr:lytic transglycosylase domain-containing protein [Solibacillus sp. R5-41]
MKTLLELQTMQNLTTQTDTNTNALSSSSSLFSGLIEDLLKDQSMNTSDSLSGLGDVSSSQRLLTMIQSNGAKTGVSSANPYLATFLLNDSDAPFNSPKLDNNELSPLAPYTRDYTGQQAYKDVLANAENYRDVISEAAQTYNLPEKLIAAVIKQESNFNPNVVSSAGASGLMQLMPATAKYLGVTDRQNPEQNIMGGAKYLRQMLDKFDNDISTALAAYNAGPGNVKKYGGIPPFKETQNYVTKVLNYYNA